MKRSITYVAALTAIAAILAWAIVGYIMMKTASDHAALDAQYRTLSESTSQRGMAARLHALVLSTSGERQAMNSAIPSDIATIVNTINATGKSSGADVQIGTASPVTLPSSFPSFLHAVAFVVQAKGSFAQVMQAAYLFNAMRIPSILTEVDLQQAPTRTDSKQWRLTLQLEVLTTAAISS